MSEEGADNAYELAATAMASTRREQTTPLCGIGGTFPVAAALLEHDLSFPTRPIEAEISLATSA
jgi:hypothetical protein